MVSPLSGRSDFLYRYSSPEAPLQRPIQQILHERILSSEAGTVGTLDCGLRIIRSLQLNDAQTQKLIRVARRRLSEHMAVQKEDFALRYLAALLLLEPDRAVDDLAEWLNAVELESRQARAERTLGMLFERDDPLISGAFERASVPALEKLLHLVYGHIRPQDDVVHESSYTPGARDNAESARNTILSALLDRPGDDAFRAMRRAADHPTFAVRSDRFPELARGKAERDAETPPWTVAEVRTFERDHTAPVKTGADLLRLVIGVLDDIVFQLTKGDVTSRPLLERAKDEDEVQNWLVEQMNSRARGRFHAHCEVQVALGDKPDVTVASTTAPCEVAVEVKHGGKGWTARQLEDALRIQLAVDYLKPSARRHGVLVVTHHHNRQWLDPVSNKLFGFESLIKRLGEIAATLVDNESGAIEVRCVGINAWREDLTGGKPKRKRARSEKKGSPKKRLRARVKMLQK